MVFADSSFWICLRDKREQHHPRANQVARDLLEHRTKLIATIFVFSETHAYFCRERILSDRIIRDFWGNPAVHIERVSVADEQAALQILKHYRDKDYSFSDALSFVIMKRLHVRQAVSFDEHFRQFGEFEVIH